MARIPNHLSFLVSLLGFDSTPPQRETIPGFTDLVDEIRAEQKHHNAATLEIVKRNEVAFRRDTLLEPGQASHRTLCNWIHFADLVEELRKLEEQLLEDDSAKWEKIPAGVVGVDYDRLLEFVNKHAAAFRAFAGVEPNEATISTLWNWIGTAMMNCELRAFADSSKPAEPLRESTLIDGVDALILFAMGHALDVKAHIGVEPRLATRAQLGSWIILSGKAAEFGEFMDSKRKETKPRTALYEGVDDELLLEFANIHAVDFAIIMAKAPERATRAQHVGWIAKSRKVQAFREFMDGKRAEQRLRGIDDAILLEFVERQAMQFAAFFGIKPKDATFAQLALWISTNGRARELRTYAEGKRKETEQVARMAEQFVGGADHADLRMFCNPRAADFKRNTGLSPNDATREQLAGWISMYSPTGEFRVFMERKGTRAQPTSAPAPVIPKPASTTHTVSVGRDGPSVGDALRAVEKAAADARGREERHVDPADAAQVLPAEPARKPHLLITPEMVAARIGGAANTETRDAVVDAALYAETLIRLELLRNEQGTAILKAMDDGGAISERDHVALQRAAVDIAQARLVSLGWIPGAADALRDMAWEMLRALTSR